MSSIGALCHVPGYFEIKKVSYYNSGSIHEVVDELAFDGGGVLKVEDIPG
jgi:hypothetical protein